MLCKKRMAEREGFEPSIRFPVYTLSKRAPSATRPSLRGVELTWNYCSSPAAVHVPARRDRTHKKPRIQVDMRIVKLPLLLLAIFGLALLAQTAPQNAQNPASQPAAQSPQSSQPTPALPQERQKLGGTDATARITREVLHELLMNPKYSVFDNLEFAVQGEQVTL